MRRLKRLSLNELAPYLYIPPVTPTGGLFREGGGLFPEGEGLFREGEGLFREGEGLFREGEAPAEPSNQARREPRPPQSEHDLSPAPLSWQQLFGNDNPVEVEVGFGKGLFVLNESQKRPEVNFFGIEIERKYQLYAAARLAKRGLKNVRLACADARLFLRDHVPEKSVQAVHVYFPDPWWKHRHKKRRLFNEDFVRECQRILQASGKLYIATDVEDYFEVMTTLLRENTSLVQLPSPPAPTPTHDLDYLTNFERKFRQQGKGIFRGIYEQVV